MLGVGAERDVRLGRCARRAPVQSVGDDVPRGRRGCDPDQRDQVELAGHGVHLADAVEGGDVLGDLRDRATSALTKTIAVTMRPR